MKKMLLISCAMLALTATTVLAGSLNISWGPECASDALVVNKNFNCATNSGSSTMVCSIVPTADHELLIACDAVIDGQVALGNTVIPNWWQFKNVGACRITALSTTASFSGSAVACADPWSGQASPTIDYYGDPVLVAIPVPPVVGNRARIKVGNSTPAAAAMGVSAGQEYDMFNVVINNTKTVGTGLCTGCALQMSWVFNSIMPGYKDGGLNNHEDIITPIVNGCVTWQGGTLCGETPTQNKTWGQVKSLYR
jgi:hypothetical protein